MKPSLVLLHGASGHSATWAPLLPAWSWAEVTALDLPGRGATPGPALDEVGALAAWLAEVIEARGLEDPVVLGHSLGGAVGLQLAMDYPGRLRALVLVSASARLRVHPAILKAVAGSTPEAPFRLDAAFGPDASPALLDQYAAGSALTPPAAALADWRACDAFDVRARLGEVAAPTLVVHGSQDALTPPRFQASLAQALPRGERLELAGPGHMLPWEAPERLAEAVRGWVLGGG